MNKLYNEQIIRTEEPVQLSNTILHFVIMHFILFADEHLVCFCLWVLDVKLAIDLNDAKKLAHDPVTDIWQATALAGLQLF
jgi:hypothetical protein